MTEKTMINCSYTSEAALYLSYMPFVKGGGLFIRSNQFYPLGQELTLSVSLLNEQEPFLVEAKVVWITPKGTQGNKPPGIGVQFMGESSRYLSNKIETYLAGLLKSTQLTDTI